MNRLKIPDSLKEVIKRECHKMLEKAMKALFYLVVWKGLERTASNVYEKLHTVAEENDLQEESDIDFRNIDNV